MGLTCSLLGHRFGDPVVEQDREERESEAVTVTREVVVCERCGERRVRSESTEVAAVADVADAGGATDPEPESGSGEDVADDEAVAEAVAAAEVEEDPEPEPDPDVDPGPEPAEEPEDEGAEILTEESGGREFGEWPEAPDRTPEPPTQPPEPGADTDAGSGSGSGSGDEAVGDTDEERFEETAAAGGGPARLTCPACGFAVGAAGSPLRAGDACPECGEAYLAERNE